MPPRVERKAKRTGESPGAADTRTKLATSLEAVLESRKNANAVFDILEYLQADNEEDLLCAVRTCSRLFGTLLERGELFVGQLPEEEEDETKAASCSAEDKYKMWVRHRYNSCVATLTDLLDHNSFQVQELALCTLMRFLQLEGKYPLQKSRLEHHCHFPRELLKLIVDGLLPVHKDSSLLISRFQEYLDSVDVRFYVMTSISNHISNITQKAKEAVLPVFQQNVFTLASSITMPSEEAEMTNYLVEQANPGKWKVTKLKEHKRVFEKMWLGFLKHKLHPGLYKKVLVNLHESILPHMSKPTVMIDFLTAAYDVGGAISLLALNGLFVLIHEHNLEYPDFYKKLYTLLDPLVFHVKYRARFFHLANLFLSSTHLPSYLVSAFAKRLSRLSLTAPPQALLMIIPFIYNLIRRHPACRALIHRPSGLSDLSGDPFIMEEEDPAKSRAQESCLWELKALQKHYLPDVAKAASVLNRPLSEQEDDISDLLEISPSELFERELKKKVKRVPLEFEPFRGLFGKKGDICAVHFVLE